MKVLITNNHNIDSTVLNKRGKLKYFINNNGDEYEKFLNLGIERYTYTDDINDFTIIEIKDEDCIDYFIKVEENNNEENVFENENVFTLQYPEGKDLSFSSGQIIKIDNKDNEYLLYNIGTKKGSSGSPIILLKNFKIVGVHKGGSKKLNIKNEKINKGIIFKKILDKIPHKNILLIEDNMIKCEYYIKKENIGQKVQVYNNQNNIEKKINRFTIYEGSEKKEEIIDGKYLFNKEGRYFIKYYFDETIDDLSSMFYNCPSLYKVNTISFSDNNKIKNISKMFEKCNYLKEIDLKNFKTKNVTDMSHMFSQCNSLEKINLSKFNTHNVKNMSYMFNDCINIKEIDLSSFDTKNVTDMSHMFSQCNSLEKINLSKIKTNNVINMSYMFSQCNILKTIDLSSFDTKNVKYLSYMFNQCNNLKEIDLSSFDTKNGIDMSYMFSYCYSLKKIKLSSSFHANNAIIDQIFFRCSSLNNLKSEDKKIMKAYEQKDN